ncbi:hypothetical protein SAY86_023345 [Trapa natans]|uniref:Hpc2-related domain-containing protein n=1 Tax=Trapa natans TaxID=22666 RepID=A0AAN7MAK6_TRANT|nr:hypothetical protein SAY86_023345 [Trapa natans]
MEEGERTEDGGADSSSRVTASLIKSGDRQVFSVDLRPCGPTTVSWKKLLKDAKRANNGSAVVGHFSAAASEAATEGHDRTGHPMEKTTKDATMPNRFNAVIEKIERLYMGKDSSDEENLDDIRDDDQYDTEDSFIDDAELDEYFEVDNARVKHDGFFVNRGKLEFKSEAMSPPCQQPKKRRRKDSKKDNDTMDLEMQNKNLLSTSTNGKPKYPNGSSDVLLHKYQDKGTLAPSKSQSGRNAEEFEGLKRRERHCGGEVSNLNSDREHMETSGSLPFFQKPMQHMYRKDGASIRPKVSSLEKAIRDLEKTVSKSKPPVTENMETDISSQAVKRRLPIDVKLKLARVAKLVSSHGKISKELINRLNGIVGHLVQPRTLKRNLKAMVNSSLSAKHEKENRFQQIKKEVADIVKEVLPLQAGASDDFQESAPDVKVLATSKNEMDPGLEDKICELYDLYIDGLDEDTGSQIRKLYAELAQLWPSGLMDKNGIRHAICRSKDRKRALVDIRNQEQEN